MQIFPVVQTIFGIFIKQKPTATGVLRIAEKIIKIIFQYTHLILRHTELNYRILLIFPKRGPRANLPRVQCARPDIFHTANTDRAEARHFGSVRRVGGRSVPWLQRDAISRPKSTLGAAGCDPSAKESSRRKMEGGRDMDRLTSHLTTLSFAVSVAVMIIIDRRCHQHDQVHVFSKLFHVEVSSSEATLVHAGLYQSEQPVALCRCPAGSVFFR